jgi:hypothetical protein
MEKIKPGHAEPRSSRRILIELPGLVARLRRANEGERERERESPMIAGLSRSRSLSRLAGREAAARPVSAA